MSIILNVPVSDPSAPYYPDYPDYHESRPGPDLSIEISSEIAACVSELIQLESQERTYLSMLERRSELERRIQFLQELEIRIRGNRSTF